MALKKSDVVALEQARIIKGKHWPFSTAATPWRARSGRRRCPKAVGASDRFPHPLAAQCPAGRLPPPPEQYPEGKP